MNYSFWEKNILPHDITKMCHKDTLWAAPPNSLNNNKLHLWPWAHIIYWMARSSFFMTKRCRLIVLSCLLIDSKDKYSNIRQTDSYLTRSTSLVIAYFPMPVTLSYQNNWLGTSRCFSQMDLVLLITTVPWQSIEHSKRKCHQKWSEPNIIYEFKPQYRTFISPSGSEGNNKETIST